jgi:hypothetical protein
MRDPTPSFLQDDPDDDLPILQSVLKDEGPLYRIGQLFDFELQPTPPASGMLLSEIAIPKATRERGKRGGK